MQAKPDVWTGHETYPHVPSMSTHLHTQHPSICFHTYIPSVCTCLPIYPQIPYLHTFTYIYPQTSLNTYKPSHNTLKYAAHISTLPIDLHHLSSSHKNAFTGEHTPISPCTHLCVTTTERLCTFSSVCPYILHIPSHISPAPLGVHTLTCPLPSS